MATHDKLIFPSAITRILCRFFVPFPVSTTSMLCVPLTPLPLNGARHSYVRGGLGWQVLPLFLLHPPPLSLLLWEVWLLMRSWRNFNAWMLALIHSLLRCQVNTHVGCISRRQARLGGFMESPFPPLESYEDDNDSDDDDDDDDDDGDASSSSADEISTWYSYPLSLMTKRGSSFVYESSHTHMGRVSIGDFC